MTKKSRRLIAVAMALVGLGTLGYYYYALIVLDAYGHMFEALHLGPVESSKTLGGYLLPFVGWLLLAASAVLFVGPELRERFVRTGRAS
jgi:hypothetical protein